MNTCGTCKWWGTMRENSVRRVCLNSANGQWSQDVARSDGAHLESAFKGNPVIVTFVSGPDFGCIHHEEKP